MTPNLPELIVDPRALSPEHHLLRVLNSEPTNPTSRTEALRLIKKRYPEFTRLGKDPENPPHAVVEAWQRLSQQTKYVRYAEFGARKGLILTGIGEQRLAELWNLEVVVPNLSRIRAEFGNDVAREVALRERRA